MSTLTRRYRWVEAVENEHGVWDEGHWEWAIAEGETVFTELQYGHLQALRIRVERGTYRDKDEVVPRGERSG